ncbi:MAG: hypothetical protein NWR08_00015 [Opitutales bacterium]|jgi:hypothetical protein|nr:hypothetical protein [Opitutales bacterium]
MKKGLLISISSFAVICVSIFLVSIEKTLRIHSDEEPLSSLRLPLKRVDAGVYLESGELERTGRVVLVRVIDSRDIETVFGILIDINTRKYSEVITNPDLQWNDDPTFRLDTDMRIPSDFYSLESERFSRVDSDRVAIRDLKNILNEFKETNTELGLALDELKRH